jgi:hypothetical protein
MNHFGNQNLAIESQAKVSSNIGRTFPIHSMIKFFPLAILALLIFKALHIRDVTLQSLSECLLPGRISLISLVFTPFEICQDKKT